MRAVAEALSHAAVPPMEPAAVLRGLSKTSTGAAEGSKPSPRASAPAVLAGCIGPQPIEGDLAGAFSLPRVAAGVDQLIR